MELTIYKNVLYGTLKPWLIPSDAEKFYRQNMTPKFQKPSESISDYYRALKELHSDKKTLFTDDGLDIYKSLPKSEKAYSILSPLVDLPLPTPVNSVQKFYHYLLVNETTRLTDRIYNSFVNSDDELLQKDIVLNAVRSTKDLLLKIGSDREAFPNDDLTTFVLETLSNCIVRLLKETEFLYPSFLNSIPTDKTEAFAELLQAEVPAYDIDKTTPLFTTVMGTLIGADNYNLQSDDRFAFGYNQRNTDSLKTVLYALQREIELVNENENTVDDLLAILTSKDLQLGAKPVNLFCETTQFSYIVAKMELHFTNFNPTSIEKSKLFKSKKGNHIKRNNLYKNKSQNCKKQQQIDTILKGL